MNHFSTVITANHLDKTLVLLDSLNEFGEATLHTLVVDEIPNIQFTNLIIYSLKDLAKKQLAARTLAIKHAEEQDELRWALKPTFMLHLMQEYTKLCHVDADICFYDEYQFLFDELNDYPVILTPHWRQIYQYGPDYIHNFSDGLYNAGFIGFSRTEHKGSNMVSGMRALRWWSKICAKECTQSSENHTYTDQRYLDLFPIYFRAKVLRHYGCNVAGWNASYLQRTKEDEHILVRGMPLIFIHFSEITERTIADGLDDLLREPYRKYLIALQKKRQQLAKAKLGMCISKQRYPSQAI